MSENSTQFAGDCFTAQTISRHYGNNSINEDVGGLAVALSNIFINVTLPIVLYWSNDNVQTTVFMLLSQIYPILIATASSIHSKSDNLSLFDAHFATAVTASPVSVYIAYSSIRDFLVGPNTLFKRIKRGKTIIRLLGATLPFFWIAMNIITSFHPNAFRNSKTYCVNVKFSQWLLFQIVSNFVGVLDVMGRRDLWTDIEGRGGLGAVALVSLWIWAIYLVRHRFDILENMEYRRQQETRLKRHQYVRAALSTIDIPFACWHVISNAHSWMRVDIVICLHWSWVLGIVKGMYLPDYEFSYGQIMSLFVIIPPFSATYDLIKTRWGDIVEAVVKSPDYLMDGFMFLLFGRGNPWTDHPLRREPIPTATVLSKRMWLLHTTLTKLLYPASVCVTLLDIAWIYGYVRGGSIPNPRTMVNNPHEAWKPFSVALYIYGYCVCCVNLLAWTYWLDRRMANKDIDKRSHASSLPWLRHRWTIPTRIRWPLLTTCIIMGAFIMSAGPVFAPPAALPLAQQLQWSYFCSDRGFPSYAILDGSNYADLTSEAIFFLGSKSNLTRVTTYRYRLELQEPEKILVFRPKPPVNDSTSSVDTIIPTYNVSYYSDLFSVTCTTNHTEQKTCATGRHAAASTSSPLTIELNDPATGVTTIMSSVDRQWMFNDDAPSTVLSHLNDDGKPQHGLAPVLQTSVTRRNHCELLKVCMSSETLDLPSVVAMGLILNAQQRYSAYCMQPRIFSI